MRKITRTADGFLHVALTAEELYIIGVNLVYAREHLTATQQQQSDMIYREIIIDVQRFADENLDQPD